MRRPRIRRGGGPRAKFDESKVRRAAGGRFGDKAGAGNDAPASAPRRTLVGEERLKTSGVTADDAIVVISPRSRRYRGHDTVRSFVEGHPRGRAYALRALAADHRAGRIGFAGAKGKAGAPSVAPPASASTPKGGKGWAGTATKRDISDDEITISPRVFSAGLVKDESDLRELTGFMLAGVPQEERLAIHWSESFGELRFRAESQDFQTEVRRTFKQDDDGVWSVDHDIFTLPKKHQGSGGAKRMLRASVEQYDRIGVQRIEVHANIDVGGYSWAKFGFSADDPGAVRKVMGAGISKDPKSPASVAIRKVLDTSSDDDLMYNLARTKGADGTEYGKNALLDGNWYGHLDLTKPRHRERLGSNF